MRPPRKVFELKKRKETKKKIHKEIDTENNFGA